MAAKEFSKEIATDVAKLVEDVHSGKEYTGIPGTVISQELANFATGAWDDEKIIWCQKCQAYHPAPSH